MRQTEKLDALVEFRLYISLVVHGRLHGISTQPHNEHKAPLAPVAWDIGLPDLDAEHDYPKLCLPLLYYQMMGTLLCRAIKSLK